MELIMSLLKNIFIAGLFLSVFVAISPAFAEISNSKNEVIVTGGKILSYKTTAKYRIADNCLNACKTRSSCEAYSLNSNGAYCVLYEDVRSIQSKNGAYTAFKADFK
tara:strand:+ start:294 stop:614 length:321 start_codon:yes stop_codon:yes gene_type:complete